MYPICHVHLGEFLNLYFERTEIVNKILCGFSRNYVLTAKSKAMEYFIAEQHALTIFKFFQHKISQEGLLHGDEKTKLQDAVFDISSLAHEHLLLVSIMVKKIFVRSIYI